MTRRPKNSDLLKNLYVPSNYGSIKTEIQSDHLSAIITLIYCSWVAVFSGELGISRCFGSNKIRLISIDT